MTELFFISIALAFGVALVFTGLQLFGCALRRLRDNSMKLLKSIFASR